jgi:hypothetical protein
MKLFPSALTLVAIGMIASPLSSSASCPVPSSEPWFMHQEDCSLFRRQAQSKNVYEICQSVPQGTKDALYKELQEQDSEFVDAALGRGGRIAVKTVIKRLLGAAAGRAFDLLRPEVANAPTTDDELKETVRVTDTFEDKYLSVMRETNRTLAASTNAYRTSIQMQRYGDSASALNQTALGNQLSQRAYSMKTWTNSRKDLMSAAGELKACSAMLLEQRR